MKKFLVLFLMFAFCITLTGFSCTKENGTDDLGEELYTGSVKSLIDRGKPVKCTYEYDDEDGKGKGTVYIADEKSRSDMTITHQEEEFESHSITDSENMYTWTSQGEGFKMSLTDFEAEKVKFEGEEEQGFEMETNYDEDFDFKCYKWSKDESKFQPPSDIEFQDFSEVMESMNKALKGDQGSMQDLCSTCDFSETEAEKQECRKALNCN